MRSRAKLFRLVWRLPAPGPTPAARAVNTTGWTEPTVASKCFLRKGPRRGLRTRRRAANSSKPKVNSARWKKSPQNAEARVGDLIKNLDAEKRTLSEKTEAMETETAKAGATELLSPAAGIVVARNGEVGQSFGPDKNLFQIATELSLLEVTIEPHPPTLRRIPANQPTPGTQPDRGTDGNLGTVKPDHDDPG